MLYIKTRTFRELKVGSKDEISIKDLKMKLRNILEGKTKRQKVATIQ